MKAKNLSHVMEDIHGTEAPELAVPESADVASQAPLAVPPTVQHAADEYVGYDAEAKRIEARMKEIRPFVEAELAKLPGMKIRVGDQFLVLTECESPKVDLEGAEKSLGARRLNPFIKVTKKLDLKAAQNYLGVKALAKFVTVSTFNQLRVKNAKD